MIKDKSPLVIIIILIIFTVSAVVFTVMLLGVLNNGMTLAPISILAVASLFLLISSIFLVVMIYILCCSSIQVSVGATAPVIAPVSTDTEAVTFTESNPLRISSKATTVRVSEKKKIITNPDKGSDGFTGVNPLRSK